MAAVLQAAAQDSGCSLKIGQSPQVRGLRLGMTVAQVIALYPRLSIPRADEFGQIRTGTFDLKAVDEAAFTGVRSVNLNFIDDRLVEFTVEYNNAPWDSTDQFVAKLRESLKLPGGWSSEPATERYPTRRLLCDKFQIDAGSSSYSGDSASVYVQIRELGAENVIAKRVAEKRVRQLQQFKP